MDPKVVVFSCNFDGWSCIEAAANSGLRYPAAVKVVRVSCLSRIHAGLILKAFELDADGVMLLGCEPDSCHFAADSEAISREYEKAHSLMDMLGIRKDRLVLVHLPPFEGKQFVKQVAGFLKELKPRPSSRRHKLAVPDPV